MTKFSDVPGPWGLLHSLHLFIDGMESISVYNMTQVFNPGLKGKTLSLSDNLSNTASKVRRCSSMVTPVTKMSLI